MTTLATIATFVHATVCLAASVVPVLAASQDRPNIVLMMADDLGWGDTQNNGHPHLKSPHLDAMAKAGLRYQRFYAAAPVCSPTRGSCLTGRHPYRYGVYSANVGHLPPDEFTLAEILRDQGYATGHFGKWHLGTLTKTVRDSNRGGRRGAAHYSPPWDNGFERCFSTEAKTPTWDPMLRPPSAGRKWWDPVEDASAASAYGTRYWSGGVEQTENLRGDDSRIIMDRAIAFLRESVMKDRPFFAVIWFHAPHLPVVGGAKYTRPYVSFSKYQQHYFGCIAALDEQVGRLRKELQSTGAAMNTMLWFCSDNGPEGNDSAPGVTKGLRGRKRSLFEGGIRVPGFVEWPAQVKPGSTTEIPACTTDYLPTILDVLGVDVPQGRTLDGVSLRPLLSGEMKERPRPIAFESGNQLSLVGNRYKLVGRVQGAARRRNAKPPEEQTIQWMLFDLHDDPGEKHDLAQKAPQRVQQMAAQLQAWRNDVREGG